MESNKNGFLEKAVLLLMEVKPKCLLMRLGREKLAQVVELDWRCRRHDEYACPDSKNFARDKKVAIWGTGGAEVDGR
jgi:hypothetical protein